MNSTVIPIVEDSTSDIELTGWAFARSQITSGLMGKPPAKVRET